MTPPKGHSPQGTGCKGCTLQEPQAPQLLTSADHTPAVAQCMRSWARVLLPENQPVPCLGAVLSAGVAAVECRLRRSQPTGADDAPAGNSDGEQSLPVLHDWTSARDDRMN